MTTDIKIADLFPSRWLKAKDLTDANLNRITDTVTRATLEDVQPQPGEHVQRLALHLAAHKPYLVTSKADATTLAEAYQVTTASQLVGRPIAIKLDVWRKQAVLRIAPPPPATAKAKPATTKTGAAPVLPPVATAPTTSNGGGVQAAPAAPPVAPPVDALAQIRMANGAPPPAATSDAVEPWPPREPWVARKAKTGEVDWVSSFWAGSAALRIPREGARVILEQNGGSFEDACQFMWNYYLQQQRDADEDAVPAF